MVDSGAKRNGLSEADLNVPAKLPEQRLHRGEEAEALPGRQVVGEDDLAESGVNRNIPGRCGSALAGNQNPGWGDVGRDASDVGGAGAASPAEGRGAEPAGDRARSGPGGLDDQP